MMKRSCLPMGRRESNGCYLYAALLCTALLMPCCNRGGSSGGGAADAAQASTSHTLSGTIYSMANTAVDSDVNDPQAAYSANDTFAQAQMLPNPVTLSGYVNVALYGADGRSFESGDRSDYFSVELAKDQEVSLRIAGSTGDNMDLNLYDDNQVLVDASLGSARVHTVTAPDSGDYFIKVYARRGASIYTMSLGHQSAGAAGTYQALCLGSCFVPHEVIVGYNDDAGRDVPGAIAGTAAGTEVKPSALERASSLGMKLKKGNSSRALLLGFDTLSREDLFQRLGIRETAADQARSSRCTGEIRKKLDTLRIVEALRQRPEIRYAEPNYLRQGFATPNDIYYPLQWHYPLIKLPQAWDVTTGSHNIIVAVIDTGVLLNHPDLWGQLMGDGYDFIQDPAIALDGDGLDNNPDDPGDQSAGGSSFHGTHVAGSIAAATDQTNHKGVAGIAWNSRILPVRVLGLNSTGSTYDIAQGIRYAAGLNNDAGVTPTLAADILNMSFGGSDYSQTEADAIHQAIQTQGKILVAAAGNDSTNNPIYPGAHDGVIAVSAVDINSEFAPYSNFGPTIDVAAPGGNGYTDYNGDGHIDGILSLGGNDTTGTVEFTYSFMVGSSQACAHVSGIAALMKAVYPNMTPAELQTFLMSGWITDDLGDAGRDDRYGYGLIDAHRAVIQAQTVAQGGTLPTLLGVNPASVNLSIASDSALLTALKWGDGALSITSVTADEPWITVTEDQVDADGLGTYTVLVDRSGLSPGSHTGGITFASTENDVVVDVNVQVTSIDTTSDAGLHHVYLVDYDTQESQSQMISVTSGVYTYSFIDIPAGRYQIHAGTNLDNDNLVGDEGEAFGAYLSTDFPVVITLSGADLTDLDFMTGFSYTLEGNSASTGTGIPVDLNR